MKNREQQIARENVSALMNGKFSFDPKKTLNKTLLFDTLLLGNDDFCIEHSVNSNSFPLKREDGRWEKAPAKSKKHI